MTTVYVVRHGATALNNDTDLSEDRIRGWKDVPLAPQGKEEAKAAAEKLRPLGIQIIVTSSLVRAHETAQIISQELGGVPVQVNPDLRPWNLGDMTGQSTKDALPVIEQYVRQQPDQPVPGGESFNQFKERADKGLAGAIQAAGGRPLVIVTHHRDERLWKAEQAAGWSGQVDLNTFLQKGDPPGGVFEMDVPSQQQGTPAGGPAGVSAGSPPSATPAGAPPPGGGVPAPPPGQGAPPGAPGQPPPQPDPQMQQMMAALQKLQQIKKAIDLLRKDIPRGYRIDIEVDTMVAGDVEQERADASEFLKAVLEFMEGAGQIVQAQPDFAPLAGKMLQFGVRKFRTGRELESAIDEYVDKIVKQTAANAGKPKPKDPKVEAEEVKAKAEMQKSQTDAQSAKANDEREGKLADQKAQLEQQKMQMEIKIKEMELQLKEREMQMKLAMQQQEGQLKTQQMHQQHQFETQRMARDEQFAQAEHGRREEAAQSQHRRQMANGASQNGNGVQAGSPAG
jgi:broad specificity phosphatase PhoE